MKTVIFSYALTIAPLGSSIVFVSLVLHTRAAITSCPLLSGRIRCVGRLPFLSGNQHMQVYNLCQKEADAATGDLPFLGSGLVHLRSLAAQLSCGRRHALGARCSEARPSCGDPGLGAGLALGSWLRGRGCEQAFEKKTTEGMKMNRD